MKIGDIFGVTMILITIVVNSIAWLRSRKWHTRQRKDEMEKIRLMHLETDKRIETGA